MLFCSDAYTNSSNNLCFWLLWTVILHSLAFDALCKTKTNKKIPGKEKEWIIITTITNIIYAIYMTDNVMESTDATVNYAGWNVDIWYY